MFQVIDLPSSHEFWAEKTGHIFLTWTIFNPHGPTVCCAGWYDEEDPTEKTLFVRWLHFLAGRAVSIGPIDSESPEFGSTLEARVRGAFASKDLEMLPSIPSRVTHTFGEEIQKVVPTLMTSAPAMKEGHWGRELYYLRKYGSDLLGRAGEETAETVRELKKKAEAGENVDPRYVQFLELKHAEIPSFAEAQPVEYEPISFGSEPVREWWETISESAFLQETALPLAQAWVGSIHQAEEGGSSEPVITSFETLRDFFAGFGHPLWGEGWSTEEVGKTIGI